MTGRPTLERMVFTVCPGRLMNSVSNMSRMASNGDYMFICEKCR